MTKKKKDCKENIIIQVPVGDNDCYLKPQIIYPGIYEININNFIKKFINSLINKLVYTAFNKNSSNIIYEILKLKTLETPNIRELLLNFIRQDINIINMETMFDEISLKVLKSENIKDILDTTTKTNNNITYIIASNKIIDFVNSLYNNYLEDMDSYFDFNENNIVNKLTVFENKNTFNQIINIYQNI